MMNVLKMWWVTRKLTRNSKDDKTSAWSVREQAAVDLGNSGSSRALQPLCTALSADVVRQVRAVAAAGLGRLGDSRAIGPLVKATRDASSDVRLVAYRSLHRLGWEPPDISGKVERMMCWLNNAEDGGDLEAVLAPVRNPQAVGLLVRAFREQSPLPNVHRDDKRTEQVKARLIQLLGEIGDAGALIDILNYLLDLEAAKPESYVQTRIDQLVIACARALGQVGDARAVPALTRAFAPVYFLDYERGQETARALTALGWTPPDEKTRAYLALALHRPGDLQRMGPAGAEVLVDVLFGRETVKGGKNANQKAVAYKTEPMKALLEFGPAAVDPLIAAADDLDDHGDPKRGFNRAAYDIIDLLYRLGDPRAVPTMRKAKRLAGGDSLAHCGIEERIGELASREAASPAPKVAEQRHGV